MLGLNPGPLQMMHWQSDALTTRLDLIRTRLVLTLQRTKTENLKQTFPEKELRGHILKFHIHVSMSDLYITTIDLPILLQEIL